MIDLKKVADELNVRYDVVCEVGVYSPEDSHVSNLIPLSKKVLMFEAQKGHADATIRAFMQYPYVKVHNVAIYKENLKEIKLFNKGSSSFVEGIKSPCVTVGYVPNENDAFYVEAKTFDNYDDGDIDILTCDIEGAEWFVLEKMKSRPKIICLETHLKQTGYVNPYMNEINTWLKNNEYVVYCTDVSDTLYIKTDVTNVNHINCINCGNQYNPFFGDYYVCNNCGLFVNRKYYDKNTLKNLLHGSLLSASFKKDVEIIRLNDAKTQINTINEYVTKKGNVYDVAAAGGFFMKAAQDDGWHVRGNEISVASINWAKANYNINIDYGYFDEVIINEMFDAIVFWNSLEHMHDPIACLNKAYSLLNENGVIYIKVPNRNVNNLRKYYETYHAFEFNPTNLNALLNKCGFQEIFIKHEYFNSESMDLLYRKS